ncbi:glucosyl transferase, partial [Agrobacterium tumefaciens]
EKPSSEVTSTFVSASETQNSESKSSVATSVTEKTAEETASHEDRTIDVTDRGIYPPPPWSSRVENVTGGEYYTDDVGFWHYRNENGDDYIDGHTIDGVKVYFDYKGRQVKGRFGLDQHFYDKDSGALATNQYIIAYNPYRHRNERYYVNDQGVRLTGPQTIDGKQVYFD